MATREIMVAGQPVKVDAFLSRIFDLTLTSPLKLRFVRKGKQKINSAFVISELLAAVTEAFMCSSDDSETLIATLAKKKYIKPVDDLDDPADVSTTFYFSSALPIPREALAAEDTNSAASPTAPVVVLSPTSPPPPSVAVSNSFLSTSPLITATPPPPTLDLTPPPLSSRRIVVDTDTPLTAPDGSLSVTLPSPKRGRSMRELAAAAVAQEKGQVQVKPELAGVKGMALAAQAVNAMITAKAAGKRLKVGTSAKVPENHKQVAKRESKAQEEAKKRAFKVMTPPTWMLMPDTVLRWLFDLFLLAIVVPHSCFLTARLVLSPRGEPHSMELLMDIIVTGIYLVHCILQIMTVVWDDAQHTLRHKFTDVLKVNMKSVMFYIDILACIPYSTLGWFMTADPLAWCVLRLPYLLKCLTASSGRVFRSINPILMGAKYVNIFFFWRPIVIGFAWGVLFLHAATLIKLVISQQHLVELSALRRGLEWDIITYYGVSLFWVLNILGSSVADHTLHNSFEFVYTALMMVFSLIFQGAVVGQLSLLLSQNSVKDTIGPTMRNTATLLGHYRIPENLQNEVLGFQHHQLSAESMNNDPFGVTGRLPKAMREQISLHMKANLLFRVPLLAQTSAKCKLLVAKKMSSLSVSPTTVIVQANERLEHLYFLQHGLCDVIARGKVSKNLTLRRGDSFGQDSLISDSPSPYTIRAITFCDLFRLSAKDFKSIAEKVPELARLLYKPQKGQQANDDILNNFRSADKDIKEKAAKKKKKKKGDGRIPAGEAGDAPEEAAALPGADRRQPSTHLGVDMGDSRRHSVNATSSGSGGGGGNSPMNRAHHFRRPTLVDDAVNKGLAGTQGPVLLMLANLTTMIEHVHGRLHTMDDRLRSIGPTSAGAGGLFNGGYSDSEDDSDEEDADADEV